MYDSLTFDSEISVAKTNIVHKANELIHLLPARESGRLNGSLRIFYCAIILYSQKVGKQSGGTYIAVLQDLLDLAKMQCDFRTVKSMCKELRRLDIEWRYVDDDVDITKIVGLLDEPTLIARRGAETLLEWKLDEKIEERLLDPNGYFTRLDLEMMSRLPKSGASIALFEICSSYYTNAWERGGPGRTGLKELSWWMPRLIGNYEYLPEYKIFKRDFLKKGMKEIFMHTDYKLELKEKKSGKTVTHIEFLITKNVIENKQLEFKPTIDDENQRLLMIEFGEVGIPIPDAKKIFIKYSNPEYLMKHLVGLKYNLSRKVIPNRVGWMYKALTNNYNYPHTSETFSGTKPKKSLPSSAPQTTNDHSSVSSVGISREVAMGIYQGLAEEHRTSLLDDYMSQASSFIKEQYNRKKFKSQTFLRDFEMWVSSSPDIVNLVNNVTDKPSEDLGQCIP